MDVQVQLYTNDQSTVVATVSVPDFPDNPTIVGWHGRYFTANEGYGVDALSYVEQTFWKLNNVPQQLPTYNPSIYDLTTVADAKDYINPSLGQTDLNKLQLYVTGVSRWLGRYLTRDIPLQTYSEVRNGTGQQIMPLIHYPIYQVTSLAFLNVINQSQTVLQPNLYSYDKQFLYLQQGGWGFYGGAGSGYFPKGFQNIQVGYMAGYWTPGQQLIASQNNGSQPQGSESLPEDLILATLTCVTLFYRQRDRVGDTGTGIGPERINFDLSAMPKATAMILSYYKNVAPVGFAGPGF